MARSLTVLLPVQNVQSTLAATVHEILEVGCELTLQFELVILDNGSKDATSEVAHELSKAYPQIRAVRHGQPLGYAALVQSGLGHSTGETVFMRSPASDATAAEIARLWLSLEHRESAADRSGTSAGHTGSRFTAQHPAHQTGYQIVHRRAAPGHLGFSQPARPNYLGRLKDFALGE